MINPEKNISQNRQNIIILLIIFLAPLFYAIWLYNSNWHPTTTSNNGELIVPARPLKGFLLQTTTGSKLGLDDVKKKWAMIYVGPANCQKACKENLYKMRQVHILQAKQQPRVRRIMIITDNDGLSELQKLLVKEYPKMIVVNSPQKEINNLVEQFRIEKNEFVDLKHRIYLMDPLGNLMMYYREGMDGRDMHKDLKRLLRKSQIG